MAEQLANLAEGTLNTTMNDSVTSLVLDSGQGAKFPSSGNFRVTVEDEIMLCTSRSTDTLTVTRGQEGTANVGHTAGVAVAHTLTKAGLDAYLLERAKVLATDVYTSNDTWSKPSGCSWVTVIAIGGGGGGGSGARDDTGTNHDGGSGGAGGAIIIAHYPASLLGSTESVTIGSAGTAGSAITSNDTAGNNGGNGGDTLFGSLLRAKGGYAGEGGKTTGNPTTSGGISPGFSGGAGGYSTYNAVGGPGGHTADGSAGGGGGGGSIWNSGPTYFAGGDGGSQWGENVAGGAGAATGGQTGGAGNSPTYYTGGSGGGGGGARSSGTAGTGGAGGAPGGGGGGGGASVNGSTSGAGGVGAAGKLIVLSF